jgi:hypothetical protein
MGRYYSIILINGDRFSRTLGESPSVDEINSLKTSMPLDRIFKILEKNEINLHDIVDEVDGCKEIFGGMSETKTFWIDSQILDPYFSKAGLKRWYGGEEWESSVYVGADVEALLREFEIASSKMRAVDIQHLPGTDVEDHEDALNMLLEMIADWKCYVNKGFKDAAIIFAG